MEKISIKWMQLSDLHIGHRSTYSEKSREDLLKYLKENEMDIDYVFITGDIIFAKEVKNDHDRKLAYKKAYEYIRDIYLQLWPKDTDFEEIHMRVFVVPGNHDTIRDSAREGAVKNLIECYKNEATGNIDESYITSVTTAQSKYNNFYNKLTKKKVKSIKNKAMHYVIQTNDANILHINTCITSCSDDDNGKLILGLKLLNDAIQEINRDKPTIAIAHHNFDCLDKDEQERLEILLKEKNISLYLCGHAHERESNIILRYNQMKMLNTFTCGTLLSLDGKNQEVNTVFFHGEYNVSTQAGIVKSYKWTLRDGWQDDMDFGNVQKNKSNYRSFINKTLLNGVDFSVKIKDTGVNAKIVSHQSSERNIAFYEMNERIKSSLSIYGVGITNVSRNTELFDRVLENGGEIHLCMVNPELFKSMNCLDQGDKSCNIEHLKFCIYSKHIDEYVRKEYYEEIQRSYKRLKEYRDHVKEKSGNFVLKLINSFVPMSINIINENSKDAELIIEYNMPFTTKRFLLRLTKKDSDEYYTQVKNIFEDIWNRSEEIDSCENR